MSKDDQLSEGCLRCRDYEQVKSELENLKEKTETQQKSALRDCEQNKEILQKKLLKVGAVAVIAGTVLGKEFVEKIASYIETFNKVTDVVSMNPSPPVMVAQTDTGNENQNKPSEEDEQDEEKDDESTKTAFAIPDIYLGPDLFTGLPTLTLSGYQDPFMGLLGGEDVFPTATTEDSLTLSELIDDFSSTPLSNGYAQPLLLWYPDDPAFEYDLMDTERAAIVPDVGTAFAFVMLPTVLSMSGFMRRRNG
tara:strand:+ start:86 stop:835 length:750 start_codon:yes stop_codon:yes gene_type:complete